MSNTPVPGLRYYYDQADQLFKAPGRGDLSTAGGGAVIPDWSDTNLPWAYTDTSVFTANWPAGVTIVPIQTGSPDFFTNLQNTVNAAGGRCVVKLGTGVYSLNSFRLIGTSGDPTYSFGFWFPNLQGLLGDGPDKTFVQMNANSMTQAQLDALAQMTVASFAPNQMGFCRLDGSSASPVLLGGLTFRAADQQMLTSKASDLDVVVPQPAPHNGVVLYSGAKAIVSYVRFQAAGRAINSQPPFEHANVTSQKGDISYYHCEFDGRRSAALDAAQPRRCVPIMGNNETSLLLEDSWFHHSNISRYAVNDQNANTSGQYTIRRTKANNISETHNVDPALNGGVTLRGYTQASVFGWESCNGTITIENSTIVQDNSSWNGDEVPSHLQLTYVGSRNPQGGRLTLTNTNYVNNGFPGLTEYLCMRVISNTYWYLDGYNTTLFIYHANGQRLLPYHLASWGPPTKASLVAANILPTTHYLIIG